MDWLARMNSSLNYIEDNLTDAIDYREVARLACCSEYHFKRMFSFIVGVTLSEYIRRRRLTLAAFDLKKSDIKVIDVASKYRYNSPDAFARAFQSLHGITPTAARKNGHTLKAYSRLTFQITIKGRAEMKYKIEKKDAFHVIGIKKRVKMISDVNGDNYEIKELWETTSVETYNQIESLSNMRPQGVIGVVTNITEDSSGQGELDFYIAAATTIQCTENLTRLDIPALTWAVFEVAGPWPEVRDVWERVYSEWFPSSGYEHVQDPEIVRITDNNSEIWIPVRIIDV